MSETEFQFVLHLKEPGHKRIFNGCEVRIENSVTKVTVRHSYPE